MSFSLRFHRRLLPWLAVTALGAAGLAQTGFAASPDEKPAARQSTYRLKPMDLLKVQVFQEAELDRELRVSQEGTIGVPLLGSVNLRNRTVREAELLLADLYRQDYLVNPQINITVIEYSSRSVDVLGSVNSPGSVTIPAERELTLLNAIARSGGFSRLANRNRITLTRTFPDGQTITYTIDADKLVEGDAANRGVLRDGDVIYVPERLL